MYRFTNFPPWSKLQFAWTRLPKNGRISLESHSTASSFRPKKDVSRQAPRPCPSAREKRRKKSVKWNKLSKAACWVRRRDHGSPDQSICLLRRLFRFSPVFITRQVTKYCMAEPRQIILQLMSQRARLAKASYSSPKWVPGTVVTQPNLCPHFCSIEYLPGGKLLVHGLVRRVT